MNLFQHPKESFLNIKIVHKFLLVLSLFILGLVAITYTFQSALNTTDMTIQRAVHQIELSSIIESSQRDITSAIHLGQDFRLSQQTAQLTLLKDHLKQARLQLEHLKSYSELTDEQARLTSTHQLLADYEKQMSATASGFDPAATDALKVVVEKINLRLTELTTIKNSYTQTLQSQFALEKFNLQRNFYIVIIVIPLLMISISWLVIIHGVVKPISYLQSIINEIAAGNLDARVDVLSQDEIGRLASAFDALLDERVTSLAKTEYEHQQLNTSIISLLRSVSLLSQKDLTIQIPVAEDMTGAVSDSINLLSTEIAATLKEVTLISARVNAISAKVKQQSATVMLFADHQHQEINSTLEELETAVNTMVRIAKFSQITQKDSEKTMLITESAVEAVAETIVSINSIRDIIREAEKRIKRLGERSQEITTVVNIINNIAERTHVLSLNAGMQAASAGEAGKGFMVVANEVQRLAESSREATEKIAALVKNIQIDTSDTMKTMNSVISQVVDGTQQAEEAGRRMKESRTTTESLVTSVKKIAATTIGQLAVGKSLKEHAQNIQNSTIKTNEQLQQQQHLADDLAQDAEELIRKVTVFKLPE